MVFGHSLGRFDETEILFVVAHNIEAIRPFHPEGVTMDVSLGLLQADFLGIISREEVR